MRLHERPARDWRIQRASAADADRLARLIAASFADVARRFHLDRNNCPSHPSLITREQIERSYRLGTDFLLAFAADRVVGCIGVRPPHDGISTLEKLAVHPDCRRRGVGRSLVESGALNACQAGASEVEVGIIAEQHELSAWYEAIGFRPARSARFDHLPFEVLYLRKSLAREPDCVAV